MDLGLQGRVALVTGASSGLGLAIARELSAEGVSVAMVARREELLKKEAADISAATKHRALPIPGDVTVREEIDRIVAFAEDTFGEIDILVAMNPETAREDVLTLQPGAAVVYDEPLKLDALRSDLKFYPVPFDKLVAPVCPDAKLRRLVRNMIYDGILAKLLDIDMG